MTTLTLEKTLGGARWFWPIVMLTLVSGTGSVLLVSRVPPMPNAIAWSQQVPDAPNPDVVLERLP